MPKKIFVFLYFICLAMLPLPTQAAPASESTLINQMAEQNFADPSSVFGPAFNQLLNDTSGNSNWINHFFSGYLPDIISGLSGVVKRFFLNPNLVQLTSNSSNSGDLTFLLNPLVNIIYGIAFDLLFVLFIFAIWQYWTKASWHGNISAMSAVGRLICTIGIVLAWPTIYSFEIELSNEMINAIFVDSTDQLHLFDMVLANTFKIGLYAGAGNIITQIIPTANLTALGFASLGGFLATVGLFALCILAIVLIYELVYLIALKAMQMALLTTQYVFAPVFLIFFATPSTEKIATGYMRTFAETSLWSFMWIGLLKILVILMYANFNPWGKIITAVGILQLMMRVPQFLGRFKVSPASMFVNPAFFTTNLQKHAAEYAQRASSYKDQFVSALSGVFSGANASHAFNGAGNNMSADFSFSNNQSTYTSPPLGKNIDKDLAADLSVNGPRENDHLKTKSSEGKLFKTHAAFNVPGRQNLPRQRDVFTRHNKFGDNGGSNIVDLPKSKQAPYEVPSSAAALLDKNSLPGARPARSHSFVSDNSSLNPFSANSFSLSRLCAFGAGRISSVGLSRFNISAHKLNMAGRRSNLVNQQLLTAHLAAAQLPYGSGSASIGRQQFVLPNFASSQHSHLLQYRTTAKFNQHAVSHAHPEPVSNIRNLQVANYSNPGSPALYFPAPVFPGWQRPYYRNSLPNAFSSNTKPAASFYPEARRAAAPFRSYYS